MSIQIGTAFVQSFKDGVRHTAQQRGSKMRPHIMVEDQKSELQAYDQIRETYMISKQQFDLTPPNAVQGRHGVSPIINTSHRKRNVELGDYILGDAIDNQDVVRTLNDFKNPYVVSFGMASGRQQDYVCINGGLDQTAGTAGIGGVFGTNRLGKGGALSISWDEWIAGTGATGLPEIDVAHPAHQIAHNNTGMTLEKWIQAKTVLDGADLVEEEGGRTIVMTEIQIGELLADPQLTSADYNTVRNLVAGQIGSFLGMHVLMISSNAMARANTTITDVDNLGAGDIAPILPLVTGATDYRRCFAFANNYLLMTMGIDDEANISRRADLNYTWYAHLAATFGSTRMEEKAFVEIQTAVA